MINPSWKARSRRARRFNQYFNMGYKRYECAIYAGITDPYWIDRLWRDNIKSENGGSFYD